LAGTAPPVAFSGRQDGGSSPDSVTVRAPHNGVYDSLWRIADRTLADGSRWPEIYALNRGQPQADGRTLTNPNLIRPGWILALPDTQPKTSTPPLRPSPPAVAPEISPAPSSSSPATTPETPSTIPATPSPSAPSSTVPPMETGTRAEPGLDLPSGAFVGLGLAAVVAGAFLIARLRRRIRYRPGSGDRADLTIAPVIRALRTAHDLATDDEPPPALDGSDAASRVREPDIQSASAPALPGLDRVIGLKEGQELAWDLARTRGLGLIGPGATGALRALLVSLLANNRRTAAQPVTVLIPAADAQFLLGHGAEADRNSSDLHIVGDLNAALDVLETELLTRTRSTLGDEGSPASSVQPELVLVATPAEHADRRLQGVLDNGSNLGLAGVLLGPWASGGTVRVRPDGTVAATSPNLAALAGGRLFTLPGPDAEAVVDLLSQTPPAPPPRTSPTAPPNPVTTLPRPERLVAPPHTPAVRRTLGRGPAASGEGGVRQTRPDTVRTEDDAVETAAEGADESEPRPAPRPPGPTADANHIPRPLQLTVLGRIRLTHHQSDGDKHADLSGSLAPKHREVLTFLALYPGGVRREALAGTLWPDAPRDRPYNSFHATLSQLRRALRTATHDEISDITVHRDGHYALAQVDVDLWRLHDLLRSRPETADQVALSTVDRVIELYHGDLAPELTAEWVEAPREALRRDVLDAIAAEVRLLRDAEPARALELLEQARVLDRYNEALYRGIGRLQARLGQRDTIPRTLALLTTTLAELDEQPSTETLALFDALQRPRSPRESREQREAG
jgi:DNA-binding SARP family transcriptional activator